MTRRIPGKLDFQCNIECRCWMGSGPSVSSRPRSFPFLPSISLVRSPGILRWCSLPGRRSPQTNRTMCRPRSIFFFSIRASSYGLPRTTQVSVFFTTVLTMISLLVRSISSSLFLVSVSVVAGCCCCIVLWVVVGFVLVSMTVRPSICFPLF